MRELKYANAAGTPEPVLHGALRVEHYLVAQAGHKTPGAGAVVEGTDNLPVRKIHSFE